MARAAACATAVYKKARQPVVMEDSVFLQITTHHLFLIPKHKHTMAAQDYKFEGWVGLDKESVKGKMVWSEFKPKTWEETDVDIKISHCGVCGSDMHTLGSGWVNRPSQLPSLSLS
jgi:hypothetical protein